MPKFYYGSLFHSPFEVATMIKIGDKHPNIKKAISKNTIDEAFTSSPCLPHDCFTFIGVSFVINSYINSYKFDLYPFIYNTYNLI